MMVANVFIKAKNLQYGFSFCPVLTDWLVEQNWAGKTTSMEKVAYGLRARQDELAGRAAIHGDGSLLRSDEAVASALRTVSELPRFVLRLGSVRA